MTLQLDFGDRAEVGTAEVSECGRYRYTLARWIGGAEWPVVFVMLNPSTADALQDDPTIRRCRGFAARLGAESLVVVNLFAFRATDPNELLAAADPVGPRNDAALRETFTSTRGATIIAAWGAHRAATPERVAAVQALAGPHRLQCLGVTASGAPRHPLYLPADAPLIPWP